MFLDPLTWNIFFKLFFTKCDKNHLRTTGGRSELKPPQSETFQFGA